MLPFYLRHYATVADEIHVWDDQSDDGSRQILEKHPKVFLHDWEHDGGIDEDKFLEFCYRTYPRFVGHADWIMWPDVDEFLYHPGLQRILESYLDAGCGILRSTGYNMLHPGLPPDDGRSQIYELARNGVPSPVYSKPIIFQPHIHVRWNRGKHALECANPATEAGIKLLHYRYLGYEYTAQKNARNFARCGLLSGDKGPAWSCAPTWTGDHSPEWAEKILGEARPVI